MASRLAPTPIHSTKERKKEEQSKCPLFQYMLEYLYKSFTWYTAFTFNKFNVFSCVFRKFFPGSASRNVGLPARHFHILNFGLVKDGQIGRESVEWLAIDQVGGSNLNNRQLIQNVELGNVETGVAVDHARILDNDHIKPTASSLASGSDAKFETNALKILSSFLSYTCKLMDL